MKKRCFNKFLMAWGMAIGLLIPSSVSAQVNWNEKDVNGNEWGHLVTENSIHSVSGTDSSQDPTKIISLWNVGAQKYLYQGGHWGTEAILSDNSLPMYLLVDGDYFQLPNSHTSWSEMMDVTHIYRRLGWVTNTNSDSQGLFIDNGSSGSNRAAAQFKFILLDSEKKIYAITSGGTAAAPAAGLVSGNQYYLSNGTNYLTHTNATVSSVTTLPSFMWTITQESDGSYTIKDGNYYLYCNNNGTLACSTNPTDGYNWSYVDGVFSTTITIDESTTWENVTTIVSDTEYYITTDGENFLTYNNGLTNATNMSSASKWVFESAGNNTWYIRLSGTNVYLRRNNQNFQTTNNNNQRTAWTWNASNGTLANTYLTVTRYIAYNSGNWTLSTSNNTAQQILKVPSTTTTETTPQVRYLVANNTTTSTTTGTSEPLYVQSAMYLDRNGGVEGNGRYNVITRKAYEDINSIPETAKWKVITRQDFISAFDHTEATNATPADATFFIGNPGLNRKGGNNWTLSNGSTSGNVTRIGNSLRYTHNGTLPSDEAGGTLEDTGDSYNSQNGDGYTITAEDVALGFTTRTANTPNQYYQAVYGGTFNGRISGTSGAATQNITVSRKGYYIVGVYAYIDGPGTAVLRAEANGGVNHGTDGGRHLGIVNIHEAETEAENLSMTKAGILFLGQEENTSKYFVTTMVYVDKANPASSTSTALEQLRITVNLSGGQANTSTTEQDGTVVAFDNFRLYYVGDADPILLDELETALDYVQPQVFDEVRDKARTLYLKRAVNNGVWNSITLPVNLTAQQVKQAFGNDTRLCRYEKVDDNLKNIIWFKELDLSNNNTVAIESGKNYIMLPTNATPATTGKYTTNFTSQEVRGEEIAEWTIEASLASPVFTINQVSMPQAPTQDPDPNADIHTTTDRYIMNFRGSYVAGNFVTPNSYIIAGNSKADSYSAGNWYHWVGTSNLAVKGFRCWIGSTTTENETWIDPIPSEGDNITEGTLGGTTAGDNENPAKLIFMIMDNDGETTAISTVKVSKDTYEAVSTPAAYNDNVYSVNGQLVGKGINALNNLAKGIYIMNGKKYVVK